MLFTPNRGATENQKVLEDSLCWIQRIRWHCSPVITAVRAAARSYPPESYAHDSFQM